MTAKDILGVVPALQATALMAKNIPNIKKFGMKPSKKMNMKKPAKSFVKRGVETIVGINLIGATSSAINDL